MIFFYIKQEKIGKGTTATITNATSKLLHTAPP